MNKFIKEQLDQCKVANIPPYKEEDTYILIKKNIPIELELNGIYIIKVEDYIVNEPEGFTLSSNWNGGTSPKTSILKIEVVQLMGKMVRVKSIGFDLDNNKELDNIWAGWLPKGAIHIKKKIN